MAATPPNVEQEAAMFLQKLIQESRDEPTKLAMKLYATLQHMRSVGKENSIPYQVISREMEAVINQHGLDIVARGCTRVVDSSASQIAGASNNIHGGNHGASGSDADGSSKDLMDQERRQQLFDDDDAASSSS